MEFRQLILGLSGALMVVPCDVLVGLVLSELYTKFCFLLPEFDLLPVFLFHGSNIVGIEMLTGLFSLLSTEPFISNASAWPNY